jgi:hypothetical protein
VVSSLSPVLKPLRDGLPTIQSCMFSGQSIRDGTRLRYGLTFRLDDPVEPPFAERLHSRVKSSMDTGSTAPGCIGQRGGLGQRVEIAMTDYALTPSLRRLRSALVIVSVDPDRRTPTRTRS